MDSLPLPMDIISHIRLYDSHPVADMVRNAYAYEVCFETPRRISELYDTYQEAYQEYTKWYNDKNKSSISIVRRLKHAVIISDIINCAPWAKADGEHHPEWMEHEYALDDFSDDLYFSKYCLVDCDWCFNRIEKGSEEHGRCMTNGDELYCEDCQERSVWDLAHEDD